MNDSIMTYLSKLRDDSLVIFLLHGVIPDDTTFEVRNYNQKHIKESYFRELVTELKRVGTPLSMDDVCAIHAQQMPLPPKSFVLTFDDGFENNLRVAHPILDRAEIPYTIYLTTKFVDENEMSWIDQIEWAFENSERIDFRSKILRTTFAAQSPTEKIDALSQIRKLTKLDSTIDSKLVAKEVLEVLGFDSVTKKDRDLDQKLNWEQIQELNRHPLVTIGGHTHTHPILSYLTPEDLHFEIATSMVLLKNKANIQTRHYSYPEGLEHCFNEEVKDVIRSFGVQCCPTAIDGVNSQTTDLFELRRVMVA